MCGISGLLLRPGERADRDILKKMADSLIRRGPDAEGLYVHQNVGLAHRRLRVLDLSPAADQPLFNPAQSIGVVYNGEIYNFPALRKELEENGFTFRTRTDTEIIIHAFEHWGTDSFRKFNGMFAFGLLDNRGATPCIYLVRDRFGVKPLFYSSDAGRLAFGSDLRPILEAPWIARNVDHQSLFHFLKFGHVPTPDSIIQGIRQLEPGTWIKADATGLHQEKFADLAGPPQDADSLSGNEDTLLSQLEELLRHSVKEQLITDVPLGCFLSGGIDSSLLVALAQEVRNEPIQTFSIGYAEAEFDETPFARETARMLGSQHNELIVSASDFRPAIREIPLVFTQPFSDPTLLSSMLLSRFAREKITVALSGDGGDELFFGYDHQLTLRRLRPLISVPHWLRSAAFRITELVPQVHGTARAYQIKKLSEILQFRSEAELFQYFIGTVGPLRMDRLARILKHSVRTSPPCYSAMLAELEGLPWEVKVERIFQRTFMLDTVLAKTDRSGMAYGLETRVPFLDNQLARFAARLPFEWKYRNGTSKYLLRKLLEKRLPPAITARKKQGFAIPLRDWLRADMKWLLDEYLNPERLREDGFFVPEEVQGLIQSHLTSKANHSHLLWSLISFQIWKEAYLP